jgi:DHA1 family multidrug/chloramphenicol efflux transport protein-like MFS transporter
MGVCFIFIGYAVIHESSSDVQAVKLTAILANVAIFAPLIGPLVGSIIANIFNWQTIFVFTAVLDIVAFIGLFMYTPTKDKKTTISIKQIIKTYWRIVSNKAFMFGIFVAGLTIIPLTGWIGLSPIMIMKTINLPYSYYISYQVIIFTGFILSNFLLQKIAGRFSFTQLIKYGSVIALIGMLSAAVFYNHITIFILAMFIYAFGYGIFNSTVLRFAISSTGESSSLTTACMSLLYCTYISLGLQFYNIMGNKFGYSIMTYAMINLGIGIVSFILLLIFAHKFVKTFGK